MAELCPGVIHTEVRKLKQGFQPRLTNFVSDAFHFATGSRFRTDCESTAGVIGVLYLYVGVGALRRRGVLRAYVHTGDAILGFTFAGLFAALPPARS